MSPLVQFLGTTDPSAPAGAVTSADGSVTLVRDGEPQEVTDEQYARFTALPGHRFKVVEGEEPKLLKGQELRQRADELDIEGRGDLSADELRAAVAAAESEEGGDSQ